MGDKTRESRAQPAVYRSLSLGRDFHTAKSARLARKSTSSRPSESRDSKVRDALAAIRRLYRSPADAAALAASPKCRACTLFSRRTHNLVSIDAFVSFISRFGGGLSVVALAACQTVKRRCGDVEMRRFPTLGRRANARSLAENPHGFPIYSKRSFCQPMNVY